MPTSKGKIKKTGDTHLPDIESELPVQSGATASGSEQGIESGRVDRGLQKAGLLKAEDATRSDIEKPDNASTPAGDSESFENPSKS